jgi:hypothetical protein
MWARIASHVISLCSVGPGASAAECPAEVTCPPIRCPAGTNLGRGNLCAACTGYSINPDVGGLCKSNCLPPQVPNAERTACGGCWCWAWLACAAACVGAA